MAKKGLLTKKVSFQGTQVTMYSIDGVTWSTRPEELEIIIQRHLQQQAGVSADLKGEEKTPMAKPKPKPKKFSRVHDDSELDEVIDDDLKESDQDIDIDDSEDSVDQDDLPVKVKSKPIVTAKSPKNEESKAKTSQVASKPVSKSAVKQKVTKPTAKIKAKPVKNSKPAVAKTKVKPKKKK
jgi:hypothetical protein